MKFLRKPMLYFLDGFDVFFSTGDQIVVLYYNIFFT